jgi:hypothetical protein
LITEAKQAEEIVTTGKVIWSLFARGTRDPNLADFAQWGKAGCSISKIAGGQSEFRRETNVV